METEPIFQKMHQAFDLHEAISSTSEEKEKKAESQSEASLDTTVLKHPNLEGLEQTEINPSKDNEELENVPASDTWEKLEIKDSTKIIEGKAKEMELTIEKKLPETATGSVPRDETSQTLRTIASIGVGTVDKSVQEIRKGGESAVTYTKEGQRQENDFEENEKKAEPQSEASLDTTAIKHPNLEGLQTTEINLSNDTEEPENVPPSDTREKLEIKDGAKIIQEEAKETELVTEKQLPETATESRAKHEAPSTMRTQAIVQGGTVEKTIQEQAHEEEESTVIDDDKSCTPENEHEQTTEVLEASDLPQTKSKVNAENEENADHQSEAQSLENMITKHTDSEEMETTESIRKSCYNIKEQEETLELRSIENREIPDGGKIMPEEAIGVPEDETLPALPTIASVRVEVVDKSIQEEIHKEGESTVTNNAEGQRQENDCEDKTNVNEVFDLHEVISSTCKENKKKAEPHSEASQDTTTIKHLPLEGLQTTEINPSNDTEEPENLPTSGTREKLEIKDGTQIIQEEAKEAEDETLPSLPTIASAGVESVDKSIEEDIYKEGESALTDKEEGQKKENDFEDKTSFHEAFDLHEATASTIEQNEKKAEPQSEASLDTTAIKHPNLEWLDTTEINPSNDTEEPENVQASDTAENLEIKDGAEIIQEEAKEIDLAMENQLPETATESVQEKEAPSTMPTPEISQGATTEKTIQEQTHEEEEPTSIDDDKSYTPENEHEQTTKVLEAIDLHETMSKGSAEIEDYADHQSEAQIIENVITKHTGSEEMVTTESIKKSIYDIQEQEKTTDLPSVENREIKDGGKITPEEAIGVPKEETLQSLPTIASVEVDSLDKSIQEDIHKEGKSALTDKEEGQRQEYDFEDKTNVHEAFDLHEAIATTIVENEKKAEPQSEASLDTTEINPSNDTEELENVQASDTAKNLEIKDGAEIIQEEAKEIELAMENQLPETATESVQENEAQSTMPTPKISQGATTEKTIQEQTHEEKEPTSIDDDKSCTPENEHEQTTKVLEAIDLPETMSKGSAEREDYDDHQSEAQIIENMITKHTGSNEMVTTESIKKSSYDVKEQENTPDLPSVENREIKDCGKITPEEAIGVPQEETLPSLPIIASAEVESVDKSIQEGQRQEYDFEDKTNVHEAFDLHEAIASTLEENEKKVEPQSQASLDTMAIKHPNLEWQDTTELNLSNDTEEPENVQASDTAENLEIKNGAEIIQEEAKEIELAIENQLPETAIESVPENEAPSTMPTPKISQGATAEKTIQEQTHEEEEPTAIDDDKSFTPENEHEQTTKVLEALDLPETMSKGNAERDDYADHQSEAQINENVITKHTGSEEMVTTERIKKSSYDVKEQEKAPDLPSVENREIKDGGKVTPEEAIGVPEDETLPGLPAIASSGVESVDKSIQEDIHKEGESALTDKEEGQRQENDFEDKTNVHEEFDLHEAIASTIEENEKKVEPQSEASLDTMAIKHPNLEGLDTAEINPSNDTGASDTSENLEIKDGAEIIQEEAKEIELAIENQLPETATESVPENEAPSTMATPKISQGATAEKTIQEQTHEEEDPTSIDDDKSYTSENEHEQTTKVLEAIDLPETMSKGSAEREDYADHQSEAQIIENEITKHTGSEEMVTTESIKKSSYDIKEQEKTPDLPSVENREIKDGGKITPGEAIGVPEDETLPGLPTIAFSGVESVDKSIQEDIHKEGKSALTDKEEWQRQEYDFEDKTNVQEAFDLHEAIASTIKENEKKAEPQSEASLDTMAIKHPNLEWLDTKEINPSNDTEEPENVQASDTAKNLKIKDGAEIIQEEAKEIELAIENQLSETAIESVKENEALSTMPTPKISQGATAEKTFQEQTHEEEEPTAIDDDKNCTPENEHEQTTKVLEAIDLPETKGKDSAQREDYTDHHSEAQTIENVITKHTGSEEMVTTESIKKSSYDVKKQEKTPDLPSVENREIKGGGKITTEEAIGVPQEATLPSLPIIASAEVESVDKSIQEDKHKEGESELTDKEEGQRQEYDFEDKTNVHEAFDLHEAIASTIVENEEKAEPQSEASLDTTAIKHPNLEGLDTTEINPSNDIEEPENVQASDTAENLEIKDGAEIIQEEAKEIELAMENQLPETATESVQDYEAQSTMPTPKISQGATAEKTIQEQTHEEKEPTAIDDDKSCTPENEHEQTTKVLEAIDLPETMSKGSAERDDYVDHQSEAQIIENVITKHTGSEEMVTTESIKKSSYDVKEQEKTPDLPSVENREIKDGGIVMPEEAIGVPEDETLPGLPTIAFSGVESVDKSIQEDIHKEGESALTDKEEGQGQENDFEDKTNVHEAFDLHEAIARTIEENEKKVEPQSEASLDAMAIKHPNLEGLDTTEINPSNDTGASDTAENLEIKDGAEIIQEEAKEIELAIENQLPETATESVPENEAPTTMPTPKISQSATAEKTIQEQTHEEDEPTAIDDDKSCTPENEHEQTTKVLEAIDLPETMSKGSAERDDYVDHQSEAQIIENVITKHTGSEEMVTTESIKKSSYDVKEQEKTPDLPSVENREIKDGGIVMPEEAIGVPEDETLPGLPTIAFSGVESVDKSIQEDIHKEGESALTDKEEGQGQENDFEDKTNVHEAFDLHEAIARTIEENEKKVEPQSEASLDAMAIKHPNLEGLDTTEINPSNDTGASDTAENLEIKDGAEIIQEEAKEIELAIENQLPETATESVPENEAPTKMPTPKISQSATAEKTIQEQTHEEDEPTAIDDDKSCTPENEHEQTTKVLEAIDLPETMSKGSAERDDYVDHQSEAQIIENVITKHTGSEEMVTTESIKKSSYDVKEQEKTPDLPSVENREIKDGGIVMPEEAIGVPEDETLPGLPTIAFSGVESVDKSIQEDIHKEGESALTDKEEGQGQENDFEDKTNVHEAFDLHEAIARTIEENEKKVEPQSEASLDAMAIKHPNLEGLDTTEINPSNDTGASDTAENLEIKDGAEIIQEEAKEIELAIENQLPETATESVPENEAPTTMPTPTISQGATAEKTIQEQTHEEEEPTAIDDDKSCTPENEHEQTTKVLEAIDLPETMSKGSAERDDYVDHQSEAQIIENVITKHTGSEEMVTTESIKKSSYDVKEQEKTSDLPYVENREIKDGGKVTPEEAIGVPEDETLPGLPTIASSGVESADKSIQEDIHKEGESALTDKEEGQRQENDFEDKTNVHEAFDLHEAIASTIEENEKKVEPHSEASLDTMAIKHPNLEGLDTAEINPSNDIGALDTAENLEFKDGAEIIQEEAKEIEVVIENQLPETAIESVPENEAPSTMPTPKISQGATFEKTIQEQTHEEEEPTAIDDDKSCTPENEHEQTTKVLEAIDLPETMRKDRVEREDYADHHSEAQTIENVITKHTGSEEMVTTESIKKSSYNVKEQEKTPDLPSVENREIKGGGKITLEEAIGVPEDETLPGLPTIASAGVESVDKSIQGDIHKEGESALTDKEEGQRQENDFEDKTNVHETFDLHEAIASTIEENEKKGEPQSEASLDTTAIKYPNLEGLDTSDINPSNDTEVPENVPVSDIREKSEIKGGAKVIQQEAKELELPTEKQLPDTATESVPDDDSPPTLSTIASVGVERDDKSIQTIHKEGESALTDTDEGQRQENDFEGKKNGLKALELHEAISTTNEEKEKKGEPQSEASRDTMVLKHPNLERLETIEINPSKDSEELENVPASDSGEKLEIEDGLKIIQEAAKERELATKKQLLETTAESVIEDETLPSLPTIASFRVESIDKIIQEEIDNEGESALTDNEEGQRQEKDSEDKTNVHEVFDLNEAIASTIEENEKKVESQSEASLDTTAIKHPNLDGLVTSEINRSNVTEGPENVRASDTGVKLEIKEGANIRQQEAKERELAMDKQLQEPATESVPEDETPPTLPTIASVRVETVDKNIQEIHKEEESEMTFTKEGKRQENDVEDKTNVLQAFDLHEAISSTSEEKEKKAEPQSEASLDTRVLKHPNLEGLETTEINPSKNTKELQNVPASNTGEKLEIKESAKIIQEEAKEMELTTEKQLPETVTEGVPKDEAPPTLPTIASFGVETVEKIIQEIHKEGESAVTYTEEGQRQENDFEDKTNVLQAFDLHEAISSTSEEKEKKAEPQSEASLDTRVLKHPNLEGLEAKEIELATEKQIPETATERIPEHEAPSTMPTPANVQGATVDKIIQEQTHEEEESTGIDDDKGCTPKNGHEQTAEVLEAIDLPETMSKVSAENEEEANHQSEAQSMENVITEHTDSEEMVTVESIKKSSYDAKELEKPPELPTVENREIKDGEKITPEEAIGLKEAKKGELQKLETESAGVPGDKAMSTLHKESISTVTDAEEGQRPENDFQEKNKVPEESDLHEATANTWAEKEKKSASQSEAHSLKTMVIKQPNLIGLETTEIGPSNNTEECEKVPLTHTRQKFEIKDCGKIILEEEKEMEDATDMPLPKSATKSVPETRSLSTFPSIESVESETGEKSTQEEIAATNTKQGQRPKKEFEDNTKVLEAFDLHEATGDTCAENKKKAEPQSQALSLETMSIKHLNLEGSEISEIIQSNDTEELEKVLATHTGEKLEIEDGEKIIQKGKKEMEEATAMLLLKSAKESVPKDEAQSTLPTSEFVKGETVEKSFQEQTLKEEESTVIDNNMICRPQNELEQTTEVLKPREYLPGGNFEVETHRETEMQFEDEHHVPGTNLAFVNQIEDVDLMEERRFDSLENLATPNEDFSSCTTIDASEGLRRDESKRTLYRTSSLMPQGVEKEVKAESFNKDDIKNIFERNDARTTESCRVNTSLDTIDTDDRHEESSKSEKSKDTGGSENIEELTIDSENRLVEAKISFPREGTVNEVKDHDVKNFKATNSNEQRVIMDLSFENDPNRNEAAPRDSDKEIEAESEDIGKLETQEAETPQIGSAKKDEGEDDFEKISPSSSGTVITKGSDDTDVKVSHKKSHGILSGVGSKVKHSISKVKKAITGKSSQPKTSSAK